MMTASGPTTTSLSEMEPFRGQSFEQRDELLGPRDFKLELETIVVGSRLQRPRKLNAVSVRKFLIELFDPALPAEYGIRDGKKSLQAQAVFPVPGGIGLWFVTIFRNSSQQRKDEFLEHVILQQNGRLRSDSDFVRFDGDYWVPKNLCAFFADRLRKQSQSQLETISEQPASRVDERSTVGVREEERGQEFYSDDDEDKENHHGALGGSLYQPSEKALGKRPEGSERRPERPMAPLPRKGLFKSKTQSASNGERSVSGAIKNQPGPAHIEDGHPFPSIDDDDDPSLDWIPVPLNTAGTTQAPPTTGSHHASLQAKPISPTTSPGPSAGTSVEEHEDSETEDSPRPVKRQRQLAATETSGTAPHDDDVAVRRPKAEVPVRTAPTASQFQAIPPPSLKREDDASNVLTSIKQKDTLATVLPPPQGALTIEQDETLAPLTPRSQAPSSSAPTIPRDPPLRTAAQTGPASAVASTTSHPGPSTSSRNQGSSTDVSTGPNAALAGFEKMFADAEKMEAREKAQAAHAGLQRGTATSTNDGAGQLAQPPSDLAFPKGPVDPRLRDVKPGPARSESERAEDISRIMRGSPSDDASTLSNSAAGPSVKKAASTSRAKPEVKFQFAVVTARVRASDPREDAMDVDVRPPTDEDVVMETSMDDEMILVDGVAFLLWEVQLAVLMTGLCLWVRDCDGDIDMDGNYVV